LQAVVCHCSGYPPAMRCQFRNLRLLSRNICTSTSSVSDPPFRQSLHKVTAMGPRKLRPHLPSAIVAQLSWQRACASTPVEKDLYELLGLPRRYLISQEELDKAFRDKQKIYHPDKLLNLTEEEKTEYEELSRHVNAAVKILRSPLDRAKYWLRLHNLPVLEEGDRIENQQLLMEMMETYEELQEWVEAGTTTEILSLKTKNDLKIGHAEKRISELITSGKHHEVVAEMEKLSLFMRLDDKLDAVMRN